MRLLKAGAAREVARTPALANLGDFAVPAVLGSWMARLSVALQRGNGKRVRAATAETPTGPAGAPDREAMLVNLIVRAEAHAACSVGA